MIPQEPTPEEIERVDAWRRFKIVEAAQFQACSLIDNKNPVYFLGSDIEVTEDWRPRALLGLIHYYVNEKGL